MARQEKILNVRRGARQTICTRFKYRVTATIKSRYNYYSRTLEFLTVPRILSAVPDTWINRAAIPIPAYIYLADPEFLKPAPVQMLVNAEIALPLLSVGQINLSSPGGPDLYQKKPNSDGWSAIASRPMTIQQTIVVSAETRVATSGSACESLACRFWITTKGLESKRTQSPMLLLTIIHLFNIQLICSHRVLFQILECNYILKNITEYFIWFGYLLVLL